MTDEGAHEIAQAIRYLAHAVTATGAPGTDAQGGGVSSLTEAVMGMTSALTEIAHKLDDVKAALEDR